MFKKKASNIKIKAVILALIGLTILISSLIAYSNYWWVFSSAGADIFSADYSCSFTAGQSVIGELPAVSPLGDAIYGFWVPNMDFSINFRIAPTYWNMDTVIIESVRQMESDERISIYNLSQCHVSFGLNYSGSDPITWFASDTIGFDMFVLLGSFTDSPSPPVSFDPDSDLVLDDYRWSTETVYGYSGYNVPNASIEFLWFEFHSPLDVDSLVENNTLTISLMAKPDLP